MSLEQRAREFATRCHAGRFPEVQPGEPYISHPAAVADLVRGRARRVGYC